MWRAGAKRFRELPRRGRQCAGACVDGVPGRWSSAWRGHELRSAPPCGPTPVAGHMAGRLAAQWFAGFASRSGSPQRPRRRQNRAGRRAPSEAEASLAVAGVSQGGIALANCSFRDVGITRATANRAARAGFEVPTLAQAAALPALLRGDDVVLAAETGSGKTLAYVLPFLQHLAAAPRSEYVSKEKLPGPLLVVVVPSADLCKQVAAMTRAVHTDVRCCTLHGGKHATVEQLGGCDMLVGTPRAMEEQLSRNNRVAFDAVRTVVVDEADLILGSFRSEVEAVFSLLGDARGAGAPRVQHAFVGATFTRDGGRGAGEWLRQRFPDATLVKTDHLHRAARRSVTNTIRIDVDQLQRRAESSGAPFDAVMADAKHAALLRALGAKAPRARTRASEPSLDILESDDDAEIATDLGIPGRLVVRDIGRLAPGRAGPVGDGDNVLVFVNSVEAAEAASVFLEESLQDRMGVAVIHKHVPEDARAEILEDFLSGDGDVQVLVATDVIARGIDTLSVAHVVQLHCPVDLATHLHRVGRTGRGTHGAAGMVTNVVPSSEADSFDEILAQARDGVGDSVTRQRDAHQRTMRLARERKAGRKQRS